MTLSCGAVGDPPPTFQWFRNDVPLEGQTQPTLELLHVTIDDRGIYNCEVNNSVSPKIVNRTCQETEIITSTEEPR